MEKEIEKKILEIIDKNSSITALFKTGYSYAEIIRWCRELEDAGKIEWDDEGARVLTKLGKTTLKEINKNKREKVNSEIYPLTQYKIKQIGIEDIYLP